MSLIKRLFAVRSVESIVKELESAPKLNRVLTVPALIAIGLGSTIGSGIFVFTGQVAATNTGPAVVLALLIAAMLPATRRKKTLKGTEGWPDEKPPQAKPAGEP